MLYHWHYYITFTVKLKILLMNKEQMEKSKLLDQAIKDNLAKIGFKI